jgi:hypothetical protein
MVRPITDEKCYVGKIGKSMTALELAVSNESYWRNIAITLTSPESCPGGIPRRRSWCKRLVSSTTLAVEPLLVAEHVPAVSLRSEIARCSQHHTTD